MQQRSPALVTLVGKRWIGTELIERILAQRRSPRRRCQRKNARVDCGRPREAVLQYGALQQLNASFARIRYSDESDSLVQCELFAPERSKFATGRPRRYRHL